MRRTLIAAVSVAGLGIALTACGDEDPTGVGSGIMGPGATTFEVFLDAEDFLRSDTTFDGLGEFRDAPFRMVANEYAGEFTAHTLFQVNRPFTVTYGTGEGSATRTDSLAAIRGATLTLVVDTVASTPLTTVEVLPVTEWWDPATVSWEIRNDTAGPEPWSTPGGTTGDVMASAIWTGASDTLVVELDSASAAVWQDTTAARRGGLIRVAGSDARIRIAALEFNFDVAPEGTPDTVLTAGSSPRTSHVRESGAPAAAADELRVGGVPVWRSLLHFQSLADLAFDVCEATGDPDLDVCEVAITDASVNLASLVLTPRPVGGDRVELPVLLSGRGVLDAPNVPATRSPLTSPFGLMVDTIQPEQFLPGAEVEPVAVPLTGYVRSMLAIEQGDVRGDLLPWLALTVDLEGRTYGFVSFSSMESDAPPRLRLVLTVPNEELYR